MVIAVPYGAASDAQAGSRTAADAAALAGAGAAGEAYLAALVEDGPALDLTEIPGAAGIGREAAEEYAALNDAALVSYWFDPVARTAHATVAGADLDGLPVRSSAVAALDVPACEVPELPPLPKGDADEPVEIEIDCGPLTIEAAVERTEDGPQVRVVAGDTDALRAVVETRLID